MNMTLTELRYIVALAQEKHFGRAAEKCHVSQPTLSVALKKLEERLGVILFERSVAEVRITAIGERLVTQAQRVLHEALQFEELASAGKDPLGSPLRLGVIYTIAPYLLPQLVPAIHRLAPRMPLYLQENFTHRLTEMLRQNEVDAIIIALPFQEAGIVTRPLYDEPFEVLLPSDHPLCAENEIDAQTLDGKELLLLGQGNCFRDQVVSACPRLNSPGGLQAAIESSSLETVRYMVASGVGSSVVPASATATWQRGNPVSSNHLAYQVRRFKAPAPNRRVALAWRVSYPRPQAIEAVYQAIRQNLPEGVLAC